MILNCVAELVGISPMSQSRPIQSKPESGEGKDAFEERTWRERMHVDTNGNVFVPPMALKNCLPQISKYLNQSVPGQGKKTYTKFFEAGVMCIQPITLNIKADDVKGERLFVPSDGKRGGGTRVWRIFPFIPEGWKGTAELVVIDPVLIDKPEKIQEYLEQAGKFIGLGRFRPSNNGYYGRFEVRKFTATKMK